MKAFFVAIAIAIAAVAGPVAAAPRAGVYENIHEAPMVDDFGGMSVEYRPGPSPSVVVVRCEGGCYGGGTWPATVDGNRIAFTVCDQFYDEKGNPAPCTPLHYIGRFGIFGDLVLSIEGQVGTREVLKYLPDAKPGHVQSMACFPGICGEDR